MATIKAYSDLQQSKVLAEILPLESADMVYVHTTDLEGDEHYDIDFRNNQPLFEDDIPAWSLAALLGVLPRIEHLKPFIDLGPKLDSNEVAIYYHSEDSPYIVRDNLVDACYEMIIKLNELKML